MKTLAVFLNTVPDCGALPFSRLVKNFIFQVPYATFPHHTVTRWLSLLPLIDRLLELWSALKSFFASIDRPPKAITLILSDDKAEIVGCFLQTALTIFNNANLALQVTKCERLNEHYFYFIVVIVFYGIPRRRMPRFLISGWLFVLCANNWSRGWK